MPVAHHVLPTVPHLSVPLMQNPPVSDYFLIVVVLLLFTVPCIMDTTLGCKSLFSLKLRNFPFSSGTTIPPHSDALVSLDP